VALFWPCQVPVLLLSKAAHNSLDCMIKCEACGASVGKVAALIHLSSEISLNLNQRKVTVRIRGGVCQVMDCGQEREEDGHRTITPNEASLSDRRRESK
jgi:hypothetical protein